MRWARPLALLVAAATVALPAPAAAYEGARLLSAAGAQRALGKGNDAIYSNPAGIALAKVYLVELGALDDLHGTERLFNASVVDSQAGPLAAGLGYTYIEKTGPESAEIVGHRVDVDLATRLSDRSALGITARYVTTSEDEDAGFDLFTLDAGFQWQAESGVSLGLTAYNLTNADESEFPISWGAGVGFGSGGFSVEADVLYNAKIGRPKFAGVLGYVISDLVPLRAGVSYDRATESISVSGGIGYQEFKFGIDLGYRQRVVHGDLPEDAPGDRLLGVSVRALFL